MEHLPHDAAIICAHLLRDGYIRKSMIPRLELDEQMFKKVQNNLSQVGVELVYNSFSPYYAVRLKPDVQNTIDQSNNMGLKNNEIAMLVILWSKLILPKRIAGVSPANISKVSEAVCPSSPAVPSLQEEQVVPRIEEAVETVVPKSQDLVLVPKRSEGAEDQNNDKQHEKNKNPVEKEEEKICIRLNELYAEFGEHFSTKTTFKSILTRLANLDFIRIYNEIITEGIFLDLLVDGYQMANEIKKSALAFKLAGIDEEEEDWEDDDGQEEEIEENIVDGEIILMPSKDLLEDTPAAEGNKEDVSL